MAEATIETQPQVDPNAALLAAISGERPVQVQRTGTDQPMPPSNGVAEGADVKQAQQVEAPPPAAPLAAETPDPFLSALTGQTDTVEWTPEAKELFKKTYGTEDPFAYKSDIEKRLAELNEVKERVVKADNLEANLNKLAQDNPVLHAAVMEQLNGGDGLAYISKQPNLTIAGKKAEDVADATLMDAYMRERFSDEEREALRTGKYDDLGINETDLKAKVKMFRSAAEFMHEQREGERNKAIQSREQQIAQLREKDTQARAAAIAAASNDRFAKLHMTQEVISGLRDNSIFNGVFTDSDGTLHPNSLTALIKAKHYDGDVARALELGEKKGYQRGLQEGTASLPTPRPGQRMVSTGDQQAGDQYQSTISQAVRVG